MKPTRIALGMVLLALTTGCLRAFTSRPAPAAEPVFDPTAFFAGRTHGEGSLDVRFGAKRTLRVEGVGRKEADGSFRLDQTITYSDGRVESRFWILRQVDATHYTATLSDAKGGVRAEAKGDIERPFRVMHHFKSDVSVEQRGSADDQV